MSLELMLGISSFAVSISGLLPIFFFDRDKKIYLFTIFITGLVLLTGIFLFQSYLEYKHIEKVKYAIIDCLKDNDMTVNGILSNIDRRFKSIELINHAIVKGLESGEIQERRKDFLEDGRVYPVSTFFSGIRYH